jgi:hypothetical protein
LADFGPFDWKIENERFCDFLRRFDENAKAVFTFLVSIGLFARLSIAMGAIKPPIDFPLGATTFSTMHFSIMTLNTMTFYKMTLSIIKLSIKTFYKMTLKTMKFRIMTA